MRRHVSLATASTHPVITTVRILVDEDPDLGLQGGLCHEENAPPTRESETPATTDKFLAVRPKEDR